MACALQVLDPSSHPWLSGLLGDPEIAGIFSPERELKRFLQVEAAWTRALGQVSGGQDVDAAANTQAETVARAIEDAAITPAALSEGMARDGVPIPALVKLLKAQLIKAQVAPEAAPLVHQGLTSQDVMDTSLMLALNEVLALLVSRLVDLDHQLLGLKAKCGDARIVAYTRMQPALETSVAVVIDRWLQPLPRLQHDFAQVAIDCTDAQWGGPVGTRDHPQADELGPAFADYLGMNDPGAAWHTDRTVIVNVAHVLTRMATTTGKIGEDIALMAAMGAEQIELSGGGSSAMAHKNNPVKAEALISLAQYAASLQMSLATAARHEGFRSGQAWMQEWLALPQLCTATGAGLIQVKELLASVKSIGRQ